MDIHTQHIYQRVIWFVLCSCLGIQSKESLDAAIGDVLAKPWLPLPLGLKPPSIDGVMVELQRQGVPKVPPSCAWSRTPLSKPFRSAKWRLMFLCGVFFKIQQNPQKFDDMSFHRCINLIFEIFFFRVGYLIFSLFLHHIQALILICVYCLYLRTAGFRSYEY